MWVGWPEIVMSPQKIADYISEIKRCSDERQIADVIYRIVEDARKLEREACAKACGSLISYERDNPGKSYAMRIRSRMTDM